MQRTSTSRQWIRTRGIFATISPALRATGKRKNFRPVVLDMHRRKPRLERLRTSRLVLDRVEARASRSKRLYLRDSSARHGGDVAATFPPGARDERICAAMWANDSSTTVLDGLIVKGSRACRHRPTGRKIPVANNSRICCSCARLIGCQPSLASHPLRVESEADLLNHQ